MGDAAAPMGSASEIDGGPGPVSGRMWPEVLLSGSLPRSQVSPRNCHSSSARPGPGPPLARGPERPQVGSGCEENSGTSVRRGRVENHRSPEEASQGGGGPRPGPGVLHVASPPAPRRAGRRRARPHSWLRALPAEGQVSPKPGEPPPKTTDRQEPQRFRLLVPTDPRSVFLLAQHLLWLFRPQSRHTRARTTSPETEKGPFVPGPGPPGTLLSPGVGHAPGRRDVFSHAVWQWAFFHSTRDGPTALSSRNRKMKRVRPPPPHPLRAEI